MSYTDEQKKAILLLAEYKSYYNKHLEKLIVPEGNVAKKIIGQIESREILQDEDIMAIASIYNEILVVDHLNGSGWADFKIRLMQVFYQFGYDSNLDIFNDEHELVISKSKPKTVQDLASPKPWRKFW